MFLLLITGVIVVHAFTHVFGYEGYNFNNNLKIPWLQQQDASAAPLSVVIFGYLSLEVDVASKFHVLNEGMLFD